MILNLPTQNDEEPFVSEFSEYLGAEQFVRIYMERDSLKYKKMTFIDSLNNVRLKD